MHMVRLKFSLFAQSGASVPSVCCARSRSNTIANLYPPPLVQIHSRPPAVYPYSLDGTTATSNWCMLEAISSCAGETALVLWQICVAFTVVMAMYPDKFTQDLRDNIMIGFHCFVWGYAGISTIIPWALGVLGQTGVDGDPTNYWCVLPVVFCR